jgi:hypothetical protein
MVVFSLIIITRARRFNMWMRVFYFSLHSRMLLLILCAWVGVEGRQFGWGVDGFGSCAQLCLIPGFFVGYMPCLFRNEPCVSRLEEHPR